MKRVKINKCPRCHSAGRVLVYWDGGRFNGHYKQFVSCSSCANRSISMDSYEEAVQTWNDQMFPFQQLSLFEGGTSYAKN